jgi:hypothetical protein
MLHSTVPASEKRQAVEFLKTTCTRLAQGKQSGILSGKSIQAIRQLDSALRHWQSIPLGQDLLDDPSLQDVLHDLPLYTARIEFEFEKKACREILAGNQPRATALKSLAFIHNYEALIRDEMNMLEAVPAKFVFLGSGALPFSAVLLAQLNPSACITCIESDDEACALSTAFLVMMGMTHRISVIQSRAEYYASSGSETIFCAALLRLQPGSQPAFYRNAQSLMVRDAEGVARFFYRQAQLPGKDFREAARTEASSRRLNFTRHFIRVANGA